ncbi:MULTISPECIES: hypothetical protein [Actinosynnema]|uniref:hypothetical protein n=1 Tax=Actinosynnema TaxID=40566 RepID=UPI0020A5F40F|nr:hypothetical protein [Actinosynnema pretiosum]MCP2097464.1 hypothetical protein [Actinosynnema pretiosum]
MTTVDAHTVPLDVPDQPFGSAICHVSQSVAVKFDILGRYLFHGLDMVHVRIRSMTGL